MFNNSAMGYIAEHTSEVRVASVSVETTYEMMTNGTLLIPPAVLPGDVSTISVELINSQNFTVIQNVSNSTSATGTVTSQQTGPGEIVIDISNAAEGDNYDLTLAMKSPDGLRDFPSRNISLKCVSFETALLDFTINGATPAAFAPNLSAFTVNVPYSTTSVTLGGTTLHSGATLAIYPGTDAVGTPLASGTHTVTTSSPTLAQGNNNFYLRVTAPYPSTATQDYAVTIYRNTTSMPETAAEIQGAINAILPGGAGTITLPNGDILLTGAITIGGNRNVTIIGPASGTATLERDGTYTTGPLIDVENGSSLTLKSSGGSLVLDGGWDNNAGTGPNSDSAAITVSGNLTLENGATVKRNKNHDPGEGGGIFVDPNGLLTMTGGSIEYNEGGDGGGVAVYGHFTMTGGSITHNKAKPGNTGPDGGGVLVIGTFTMSGGEIAYNTADRYGGGIHIYCTSSDTATFTMSGSASIHNNEAQRGGGIDMWQNGGTATFTMNGGTITANTATSNGGGGYNSGGSVGGTASPAYSGISGNSAPTNPQHNF
jgi:hypothetical protein